MLWNDRNSDLVSIPAVSRLDFTTEMVAAQRVAPIMQRPVITATQYHSQDELQLFARWSGCYQFPQCYGQPTRKEKKSAFLKCRRFFFIGFRVVSNL